MDQPATPAQRLSFWKGVFVGMAVVIRVTVSLVVFSWLEMGWCPLCGGTR